MAEISIMELDSKLEMLTKGQRKGLSVAMARTLIHVTAWIAEDPARRLAGWSSIQTARALASRGMCEPISRGYLSHSGGVYIRLTDLGRETASYLKEIIEAPEVI